MEGDEGMEVAGKTVASIGGPARIAADGHTEGNGGPQYNENPGVAVTTKPYPAGTRMSDTTPGDEVN